MKNFWRDKDGEITLFFLMSHIPDVAVSSIFLSLNNTNFLKAASIVNSYWKNHEMAKGSSLINW